MKFMILVNMKYFFKRKFKGFVEMAYFETVYLHFKRTAELKEKYIPGFVHISLII